MDEMRTTLRVEPDVILAKADELDGQRVLITQIIEQAQTEILSLGEGWQGLAAAEYQRRFRQLYNEVVDMLSGITTHIQDIREVAQAFGRMDASARSAAEGLPDDAQQL